VARRGIDLKFSLRGKEYAKLKEIIAQPYIFAPVPGQGAYAISGKISEPTTNHFKINDFKYVLADNELSGWLDFNLAGQLPVYEVELSSPKFNLKPFPIPKEAAYANLNKIDDLGPLKIHSKVIVEDDQLFLSELEMQAGSEQLATIEVKGSIKDLTTLSGIDLDFSIRGNEVANLKKITGQSIPLKGAYGLAGKLTDPAQKNYKLGNLKLKLGENNITGSLPALETLSRIEDLGPLKLAFNLAGGGEKLTLDNLDFKLGREDLIEVVLKGTIKDLSAVQGMKLEFSARGNDMSNFKKLGGPGIQYTGAFNVSAQFIDAAPKVYRMPSFNATVGDNNQKGWLELDLSAQRPSVKGELSSDKLDLRPLLAEDKKESTQNTQSAKPVAREKKREKGDIQAPYTGGQHARVFSADPLPLEGLQAIDVDLKFDEKCKIEYLAKGRQSGNKAL